MQDFISLGLEYTREYESPSSFWRWSFYAIVGAALRYNVHFTHPLGKVYPNIYTLLLADSAEYRKDAGLKMASELLREVGNTKIVEGRASFQAIADDLSTDIGDKKTGLPKKGGACIIIAPELASFFVADPQLIPNITNWYDFKDEDPVRLKSGTVTIKNRCINLLAASNETFLREVYTDRAVYGGLLRRTFLIKPDETRKANSLMYMDFSKYNKKVLIDSLNEIIKLQGEVKIDEDAKKYYDEWYGEVYRSYKTHPDRTGVSQGMHTNALKLAIIIAASRYSLNITTEIMNDATIQVTALKSNYEIYAMSAGPSDFAAVGGNILADLWKAERNHMTRSEILSRYWNTITAEDLDKLIATFEQAGLTRLSMNGNKHEPGYTLTEKCKEIFVKKGKGKGI